MNFMAVLLSLIVPCLVLLAFYMLSNAQKFEDLMGSSFECGFTSYFFSRFSFSIQYFLVALIFLFLDLEICVVFPVFTGPFHSGPVTWITSVMVAVLLWGLVVEWANGKLDWIS